MPKLSMIESDSSMKDRVARKEEARRKLEKTKKKKNCERNKGGKLSRNTGSKL